MKAARWVAAIPLAIAMVAGSSQAQPVAKPRAEPLSSETNVRVLGAQILSRWAPVAEAAGVNMQVWQEQFSSQFAQMPASSLQMMDGVQVNPELPAKANYDAFSQSFRSALMTSYLSIKSDKPGTKLGSTITDFVFIPVVPCRIVDTRNVGGPIAPGFARNFFFYTASGAFSWSSQGGAAGPASSACLGTVNPNGGNPSAAMISISVVSPTAPGNWITWGGASPIPTAASLLWSSGQNLTATTLIPWGGRTGAGPGGAIQDFAVYYNGTAGAGNAHFVADVVGYFVENQATALDCVATAWATKALAVNALDSVDAPACATGYTLTGGDCWLSSSTGFVNGSAFFGPTLWRCYGHAPPATTDTVHAAARCCRVPGR